MLLGFISNSKPKFSKNPSSSLFLLTSAQSVKTFTSLNIGLNRWVDMKKLNFINSCLNSSVSALARVLVFLRLRILFFIFGRNLNRKSLIHLISTRSVDQWLMIRVVYLSLYFLQRLPKSERRCLSDNHFWAGNYGYRKFEVYRKRHLIKKFTTIGYFSILNHFLQKSCTRVCRCDWLKGSSSFGFWLARFDKLNFSFWEPRENFSYIFVGNFHNFFSWARFCETDHDGARLTHYWRNAQNFTKLLQVPTYVILLEGFFSKTADKNCGWPFRWLKIKS